MNADRLKELAGIMAAVADGAEWECHWEDDGWAHPAGRDMEYCIANGIAIRIKSKSDAPGNDDGGQLHPQILCSADGIMTPINGLSKRDWFAGMALAGLPIPQVGELDPMAFSRAAYDIADAMLAAGKEDA